MQVAQVVLNDKNKASQDLQTLQAVQPDLLLVFGAMGWLSEVVNTLGQLFPDAIRMGCSTAGEISARGVSDQTCVVTAVRFEHTQLVSSSTVLTGMADSLTAGQRLAQQLPQDGLRAVVVLGQGVAINGSALIEGLTSVLGKKIPLTGGLAGDAAAFRETWVLDNTGVHNNHLVCLGLYGEALSFTHGSFGGWQPFGPARKVTRCANNVLFELDGEPALAVYKRYLGEHAKDLPGVGLLFPFAMLGSDHTEMGVIRTILGMDEVSGSLTLAGDIDPTGYLRLMHASTDALVDGADAAAQMAQPGPSALAASQSLALLVSCVGRKLVMGGRVDEEVEAIGAVFGQHCMLTGFYSNGEISPLAAHTDCKLNNQTMTVTLLTEAAV